MDNVIQYFKILAQLINSHCTSFNCSLVLSWFELDNKGNHLSVSELHSLNIPAIAAAQVVKRHVAESDNELNLDLGDLISLIDMPSPSSCSWWRGKKGFKVGYFPHQCVNVIDTKKAAECAASSAQMIDENLSPSTPPSSPTGAPGEFGRNYSKPVLRTHGKMASCLQVLFKERPSRDRLRQSGIVFDRVFGCDLGQYLANHNQDIPLVVRWCADMIERCGIVDGVYRHSGSSLNIQALRTIFDSGRLPDEDDLHTRDPHAVSGLLKSYFRELPNPLLTHALYFDFVETPSLDDGGPKTLRRLRSLLQCLPPPHHRTLRFLLSHLKTVANHSHITGMTPKNLAIVYAPNLLRPFAMAPRDYLNYVTKQAKVVELLIIYNHQLFDRDAVLEPLLSHNTTLSNSVLLPLDVAQKLYQSCSLLPGAESTCHGGSRKEDKIEEVEKKQPRVSSTTATKCRASLKKFASMFRDQKVRPEIIHCNEHLGAENGAQRLDEQDIQFRPRSSSNVWRNVPRSKSSSSQDDVSPEMAKPITMANSKIPRRNQLASDNSMVWTGNQQVASSCIALVEMDTPPTARSDGSAKKVFLL